MKKRKDLKIKVDGDTLCFTKSMAQEMDVREAGEFLESIREEVIELLHRESELMAQIEGGVLELCKGS